VAAKVQGERRAGCGERARTASPERNVRPRVSGGPNPDTKKAALESLVFLKEKCDGSINWRACADGRKQREGSTKSDATSPTVALESVLITATIDAHKGREVAIVDVPGAYLTAEMDEDVSMCIRGRLAELMVNTAPEIYSKYIYVGSDNKCYI
jgi:hypothetical protein